VEGRGKGREENKGEEETKGNGRGCTGPQGLVHTPIMSEILKNTLIAELI